MEIDQVEKGVEGEATSNKETVGRSPEANKGVRTHPYEGLCLRHEQWTTRLGNRVCLQEDYLFNTDIQRFAQGNQQADHGDHNSR